jgi:maleate cis-trans isomerase
MSEAIDAAPARTVRIYAEGERPAALQTPKARIGLIIPSSNRLSEPQFVHYAPAGIGIHTARLRMTGPWHKPLGEIHDAIALAAGTLADSDCDVIVFNCTGGAMSDGPEAEAAVLELIARETGAHALSTGEAVVAALRNLMISRPVLLSPYIQATNDAEIAYLSSLGISVAGDVALGLSGGSDYITVPPERWLELALEADRADADGFFLSCTNTTQIETVGEIERRVGKPCINSNQAVLWAALRHLAPKIGGLPRITGLGRLFGLA